MSFYNLTKVEKFTFQIFIKQDGNEVKKMVKFDSLLNGIIYVYAYKILNSLASGEISIYDTNTKKKLVRGDIDTIYDTYLKTFPRPKYMSVDDFMINILQLLSNLKLDVYAEMSNNHVVQRIMKINTDYTREVFKNL